MSAPPPSLPLKDWMEINNNVLADVRDVIDPYVDWVEVVQHKGYLGSS